MHLVSFAQLGELGALRVAVGVGLRRHQLPLHDGQSLAVDPRHGGVILASLQTQACQRRFFVHGRIVCPPRAIRA